MVPMQTISPQRLQQVLGALPGVPRVLAAGNHATPTRVLQLLDEVVPEYRLHMLNAQKGIPDRPGVSYETAFVGPGMRGHERLSYYPSRLSLLPGLIAEHLVPDVVLLHTSPPADGVVSLGIEVNILPAAIEAARRAGGIVIAQVNRQMPRTSGDALVDAANIDYLIEVDEPLPAAPVRAGVDPVSATIGENVAGLIPDGATLQLGIGAIPDATLHALYGRRDLRVWSEMFSDGVLALENAGALDPDMPITASFCFGTTELYEWLDRNPRVRMLRTETTNDPGVIARQPGLVSVNSALQVDLFGQANASRVNGRIYSGFGGQTDFVVGALHSAGGGAIIALPSWHPKANVSTVVPLVDGPVTSFQHAHIVTEQGVAAIRGYDANTQAQHLIDYAAHPDARDGLRKIGAELGLRLS